MLISFSMMEEKPFCPLTMYVTPKCFIIQPLMARLQNALTKQLTDEHERIDLQLREKEEEVRKVRQSREETGVQLYGVQHQLAKMQTTFERTHDNYNIVQRYRVEAERQHEILQRQYEGKKEEADEQLNRVLKA